MTDDASWTPTKLTYADKMQAICVLGGTAAVIVGFGPSSGIGIAGILWTAWGMAFGLIDYWKQRRTP